MTLEMNRKVKDLVRLALAAERQRVPLKREDIAKKVLKDHSRAFRVIFEKTQVQLRRVFGMELVELPTREKAQQIGVSAARRAAVHREKTSTNTFVLRSILPAELRHAELIDWGEDAALMGFSMVVLSLIYVNERTLSEERLHHYLRKLGVTERPHPQLKSLEVALMRMVKIGYLDRVTSSGDSGDVSAIEYRWGPRAKVEMDEREMADFVVKVFGDQAPADLVQSIRRASGVIDASTA
ncbi:MAGE homology domain-containing protein [Thamnocephalis sphaerospora]|uniref:MAGE homology domain-containing protein n=1 Tax=Thamnocephalis sphaerospora TaxID=78915 RepID=A0A4P9XXJ2_9FUNG|nr:MAGE homology domain-containing protein [Thamnocephalis sphaerospora]|eukprot:RKP11098.1 MAGE homology domain-containing protein [Thamnocephalis sphaerospora]